MIKKANIYLTSIGIWGWTFSCWSHFWAVVLLAQNWYCIKNFNTTKCTLVKWVLVLKQYHTSYWWLLMALFLMEPIVLYKNKKYYCKKFNSLNSELRLTDRMYNTANMKLWIYWCFLGTISVNKAQCDTSLSSEKSCPYMRQCLLRLFVIAQNSWCTISQSFHNTWFYPDPIIIIVRSITCVGGFIHSTVCHHSKRFNGTSINIRMFEMSCLRFYIEICWP